MTNWIEIKDFNTPELGLYASLSEVQLLRYYEPYRRCAREPGRRRDDGAAAGENAGRGKIP